MTVRLDLAQDILKMYLHIKNEVWRQGQGIQTLESEQNTQTPFLLL